MLSEYAETYTLQWELAPHRPVYSPSSMMAFTKRQRGPESTGHPVPNIIDFLHLASPDPASRSVCSGWHGPQNLPFIGLSPCSRDSSSEPDTKAFLSRFSPTSPMHTVSTLQVPWLLRWSCEVLPVPYSPSLPIPSTQSSEWHGEHQLWDSLA